MQVPVGEHIRRLQQRLEELNEEIMRPSISLAQRNKIESDIRAVNLALRGLFKFVADQLTNLVPQPPSKSKYSIADHLMAYPLGAGVEV